MTLAVEGYARSYARSGVFPPSRRAIAMGRVVTLAPTADLILETGHDEGLRSKREEAHKRLYRRHRDSLVAALLLPLHRLDIDKVSSSVAEHAAAQHAAGSNPVQRRRAVAGVAAAAIAAQVTSEDRQNITQANAEGWISASAYGTGEATATPHGGPPNPALIAAGAAAALKMISTSQAMEIAAGWTDLELNTIAMGAALAAGDGAALGEATRAVKAALVDTGRADAAYGDLLHQTVVQAYLAKMSATHPDAYYDYVTDGNPCGDCVSLEAQGPYLWADFPTIPQHFHCMCDCELSRRSVLAGVS